MSIDYFELTLESRAAKELLYELASKHLVDHWMVHWTRAFFSLLLDVVLIDAIADFVVVAVVVVVEPIQMETSSEKNSSRNLETKRKYHHKIILFVPIDVAVVAAAATMTVVHK